MALTDVKVKTAKPKEKPYKLADGGGMYLLINANGSKYWRIKYRFAGKEKMLSICFAGRRTRKTQRSQKNPRCWKRPGRSKERRESGSANELEKHFRGRCPRMASNEIRSLVITLS